MPSKSIQSWSWLERQVVVKLLNYLSTFMKPDGVQTARFLL